jgi:uncharacterized membrane protein
MAVAQAVHRQRGWARVLRLGVVAVVDLTCMVTWLVYSWTFWATPGQSMRHLFVSLVVLRENNDRTAVLFT